MNTISEVYVKVDKAQCIISVNSNHFLSDLTGWIKVDEGIGDQYYHAQNNYFPDPLFTEDHIPVYKIMNGEIVSRTLEEIQQDRDNLPIEIPLDERVTTNEKNISTLTTEVSALNNSEEALLAGINNAQ